MNTKKIWRKLLQLPDTIQDILGIIMIIFTVTVISIIIVETLMLLDKSQCLDSQYPRRYYRYEGNVICEEYRNGKWDKPLRGSIYYYNEAGNRMIK